MEKIHKPHQKVYQDIIFVNPITDVFLIEKNKRNYYVCDVCLLKMRLVIVINTKYGNSEFFNNMGDT